MLRIQQFYSIKWLWALGTFDSWRECICLFISSVLQHSELKSPKVAEIPNLPAHAWGGGQVSNHHLHGAERNQVPSHSGSIYSFHLANFCVIHTLWQPFQLSPSRLVDGHTAEVRRSQGLRCKEGLHTAAAQQLSRFSPQQQLHRAKNYSTSHHRKAKSGDSNYRGMCCY